MPLDIPVLETERLVLRGFREDDLDAFARLMADQRVARWLGGQTLDRDDSWRSMATHLGHWVLRGYGQWAVEEKATGDLVGRVGHWRPEGWPGLEVGWMIDPDRWGRGYATEGGAAALADAFTRVEASEVISLTLPDNLASRRVMEKLGLRHARDQRVRGFDQVIYAIERARWRDGT